LQVDGRNLWTERTNGVEIDTVVIHAINAGAVFQKFPFSVKKCIKILEDYDVSSHYIIDRKGKIYQLVPEEKKAWHAGVSKMPAPDNRDGVNDFSIGIELIGNEELPFENKQYEALNFLLNDIKNRQKIKSIVGHSQIATQKLVDLGLRKDVKWDPGKQFDWKKIGRE
jgi:N-acetyl-anhydromuramyl-L-alanine amidase AmpD